MHIHVCLPRYLQVPTTISRVPFNNSGHEHSRNLPLFFSLSTHGYSARPSHIFTPNCKSSIVCKYLGIFTRRVRMLPYPNDEDHHRHTGCILPTWPSV